SAKNPGGAWLWLVIAAHLPPIQLGFGFTMTGIGGLLGVQHTINTSALSSGLSTGSLDSFLFPQNPIANAPQIINQLRTIFPFKAGRFVFAPVKVSLGRLLRDSRVLFISLTGQFAFRALFGAKPSFLLSAGGFHPRF